MGWGEGEWSGGGGGSDREVFGQVSDRDAQHQPSTQNAIQG